jgi:hypothetical protein
MDEEILKELNLFQLKEKLKEYGLPESYNKPACIQALLDHFKLQEGAETLSSMAEGNGKEFSDKDYLSHSITIEEPEDYAALRQRSQDLEKQVQFLTRQLEQLAAPSTSLPNPMQREKGQANKPSHPQFYANWSTQTPITGNSNEKISYFNPLPNNENKPMFSASYQHESFMPPPSQYCQHGPMPHSTTLAAIPPAQAITLLSSQIPSFSGTEDEDIEIWIRKIDRMASIHQVDGSIKLLAATRNLHRIARDWFDLEEGLIAESWDTFKNAILRRFKRRVSFSTIMQRAESCKWNYPKENFAEYSMRKQKLIQPLHLSPMDTINLLIGGISNFSIRGVAASLNVTSVDDFLERMDSLLKAYGTAPPKKSPPTATQGDNLKESLPTTSSASKVPSSKLEKSCAYCRAKGHEKIECWKLKRKESSTAQPNSTAPVAAAEERTSAENEPEEDTSDIVASVSTIENRTVQISEPLVKIISLDDVTCDLNALIDTGSPASFITESAVHKYLKQFDNLNNTQSKKFYTINDTSVNVIGCKEVNLKLSILPETSAKVLLYIIKTHKWSTPIILGRDFLAKNNLKLHYHPSKNDQENKLSLLSEVASADVYIDTIQNSSLLSLEDVKSDFGLEIDKKILQIINEAHSTLLQGKNEIIELPPVTVTLKDMSTYAYAPRKFALSERRQIREIMDDLLARKIVKESTSPYCARIILVRKRSGKLRLCIDLRPLNARVVKQKYPFPLIENFLSLLANKIIFTVLDLKESFLSISIHCDSTKYFSFATPDGQYEFTKLPFGYSESPAEFQKRLLWVLQPLIRENKILVYMDDILIASETIEENLQTLLQCLILLKKYNFEVNYLKCKFLKTKVEYLGYLISKEGVTLSDRHVVAIKNFPEPKNTHEIQRFLGLVSYFRKFIADFAKIANPLYSLLKKNSEYKFNNDCLESFNKLKDALVSYPILQLYDPNKETELHTDASAVAIAAILLQRQENGQLAPIAYFSQANNSAETRYHSYELEMLAVVKSIERFHIYLYGIKFKIVTDCHAVVFAVNKANLNPRIARWTIRLQSYNFEIVHRHGAKMSHVDALSRIVAAIETLPLEKELYYKQLTDPQIQTLTNSLEENNSDKFELIEGLVYRKFPDKSRFYVPESMVPNVIRVYHDNNAHCGVEKTVQGIIDTYWFPYIRKRVRIYIDNCLTCLLNNTSTNVKEGEIQLEETPQLPMQSMHADHFGPIKETPQGYKHILVLVDSFTRFTWLCPTRSTSSKETISKLDQIFNVFGNPKFLTTDRGTSFTSFEFSNYVQQKGIKHRLIAVAAPWANGTVERINRFLKSSLKKIVDDQYEWSNKINEVQYTINNTYHSAIKCSPAKLLFGIEKLNQVDTPLIQFLNTLAKTDLNYTEIEQQRSKNREIAKQASDT